jgi:carboxyl-terminal processing protease
MDRPAFHARAGTSASGPGLFVLGLAVGLLFAWVVDRAAKAWLDDDLELVRAVRDLALDEFVSAVDSSELTEGALRGMLAGLDRYSRYYDSAETAGLDRETTGEFRGIGVVFRSGEPGRVLFPYPGSPAHRSGVAVGDRILAVDGHPLTGLGPAELQSLLHASQGELVLDLERLDGSRIELAVEPGVVLDPTVRHARMQDAERGIGYLAILAFSHRTPREFDESVEELAQRGLRSLIVDLRSNPGGILEAAVQVANRFLDQGTIVTTRMRDETRVTEALPAEAKLKDLPLVLLVDENSASASEVLAGALQDHCAAVLVGEPTYGKGTVQTLKRITRERGVVKLTTAFYSTPSGRRIEHDDADSLNSGIAPDLLVALGDEEKQAIQRFLFSYPPPEAALPALREWETREQVRLIEEPPEDRQLDSALALLAGGELDLHARELR